MGAGILPTTIHNDKLYFLFGKENQYEDSAEGFSDFGGGTDNKALHDVGIVGYGFSPLRLPKDLDFFALFHGVDERVPIDGLKFGVRVLYNFLDNI